MIERDKPNDELLMNRLKNILLHEDREELAELRKKLNDPKHLSEKVAPHIKTQLAFFKENFSEEYKAVVNELITQRLKESKEEIIEVLYPEMGKMIRKYITHQFQMLKESIEDQMKNTFSKAGFFAKIRTFFPGGRKAAAADILSKLDKPVIEEIYLIQRDSGLLLGHASQSQSLNRDLVAGMLTAIKAFVEDAFQKNAENLEMIEYGSYKIFIQTFRSYYIAIAISGSLSAKERNDLSNKLIAFADKELKGNFKEVTSSLTDRISEKLFSFFLQINLTKQ
ncbi:MAG TPA: hypothetical protein ENK52_06065 [Saprospiraceae bacterium]|nr:hypothetical protein [Saprospiraceae bacterium]